LAILNLRCRRCHNVAVFPSLHHRKEGWLSKSKNIAKHPLIAKPGWFSDGLQTKTPPASSVSVATQNLLDDSATPPCGDARRGIASIPFHPPFQFIHAFIYRRYSSGSEVPQPPLLRLSRWLRKIFLMTQPPLLAVMQ